MDQITPTTSNILDYKYKVEKVEKDKLILEKLE